MNLTKEIKCAEKVVNSNKKHTHKKYIEKKFSIRTIFYHYSVVANLYIFPIPFFIRVVDSSHHFWVVVCCPPSFTSHVAMDSRIGKHFCVLSEKDFVAE